MTAVASPSSFQSGLPRNGWVNGNGTQINLSGMFVPPRKSVQRSNSSTSLSSSSSSSSTSTSTVQESYKPVSLTNHDSVPNAKKRPSRGVWPSSKAEPVSGLSNARPHSIPASSGTSAASAISALHSNPPASSQQHMLQPQGPQNGVARSHASQDAPAVLHLLPMNGTFERKTITIPFGPDILRIGRQTNARTIPNPWNGYFDSKVLSRQHAEVWADKDGKIWIRDVKSSNGTFVNGKRLSPEARDSEPHPLKESDVLELGIDIVSEDQKTVVHHKVAARVEQAGIYRLPANAQELNFAELESPSIGGHLSAAGQGFRNRSASQNSITSNSRFGVSGSNMVAFHSKWLQPVTMDQIMKRLNNELRQARLQSHDLHHTGNYVDAVLSNEKPIPLPQSQKISSPSKSSEAKTRFAEPPAPPPSQPLPEKPDGGVRAKMPELPALQPILQRSDTEKPRATPELTDESTTIIEQGPQVVNLVEALNTARKEIISQRERLNHMEEALRHEQEARNAAEERAKRPKSEMKPANDIDSDRDPAVAPESQAGAPVEGTDTSQLQQRFDLMRVEMDSMRQQMERYRQRTEAAEQDSHRNRETLAEMVARIRRRDEAAKRGKEVNQGRKATNSAANENYEIDKDCEDSNQEGLEKNLEDDFEAATEQLNGHIQSVMSWQPGQRSGAYPISKPTNSQTPWSTDALKGLSRVQLEELASAVNAAAGTLGRLDGSNRISVGRSATQERLVQSAPYASIVGVVIVGVSLMAYLNGWSKGMVGER